jgi:uncharacterized membrane protein
MISEPNLFKRILLVISIIADGSAVCFLAAQVFRQDLLLLLTIIIILIIVGGLLWRMFRRGWIDRQNLVFIGGFFLASMIFAVVCFIYLSNVRVTPIQITISEPGNDAKVEGHRYLVKGTISDQNSVSYVVVRSLESSDYWVQDPPTIDSNNNWQVNTYFGERNVGNNERYEIIALATHENFLVTWLTGNYLSTGKRRDLPNNTNRSNVVTVTRTR